MTAVFQHAVAVPVEAIDENPVTADGSDVVEDD